MSKQIMWYLGMAGGVAARGPLAALVKSEEEGICCLERRLSSLSTCFITFSVSFMRACSHTTSHHIMLLHTSHILWHDDD